MTKGVPTSGRIANGAIIEREVALRPGPSWSASSISLRNPDFTTARRIADAINAFVGRRSPVAPTRAR